MTSTLYTTISFIFCSTPINFLSGLPILIWTRKIYKNFINTQNDNDMNITQLCTIYFYCFPFSQEKNKTKFLYTKRTKFSHTRWKTSTRSTQNFPQKTFIFLVIVYIRKMLLRIRTREHCSEKNNFHSSILKIMVFNGNIIESKEN